MKMLFRGKIDEISAELEKIARTYGTKEQMAVIIADSKLNCHPLMLQALKPFMTFL